MTPAKLMVLIYGVLMFYWMSNIENITVMTLIFYTYTFSIIFFNSKKSLMDPRTLLLGFFTIYSTFYALKVHFIGFSLLEIRYAPLIESVRYQFFAAIVFVTVLDIIINEKNNHRPLTFHLESAPLSQLSQNILYYILLPIFFAGLLIMLKTGATSKQDILQQSGPVSTLVLFDVLILTVIAISRALRLNISIFRDPKSLFFIFICLLLMLFAGERDVFFRTVFIFFLITMEKKQYSSFKLVMILIIAAVFIVPISQAFKAVLISKSLSLHAISLNLLLSNEFISASRNLYSLLLYNADHSLSFLLKDIVRAFIPSILLDNSGWTSTVLWFHNVFRVENGFPGRSGWGFGLAAEGYLIGRYYGIIIVMTIYGGMLGVFYNLRYKSEYWYTFYLLSLVTSIYVLRADVANLLSQTLKIGGLSVLLLYIAHIFLLKKPVEDNNVGT